MCCACNISNFDPVCDAYFGGGNCASICRYRGITRPDLRPRIFLLCRLATFSFPPSTFDKKAKGVSCLLVLCDNFLCFRCSIDRSPNYFFAMDIMARGL